MPCASTDRGFSPVARTLNPHGVLNSARWTRGTSASARYVSNVWRKRMGPITRTTTTPATSSSTSACWSGPIRRIQNITCARPCERLQRSTMTDAWPDNPQEIAETGLGRARAHSEDRTIEVRGDSAPAHQQGKVDCEVLTE